MEENETVLEYNGITGETTIRPQTPEELAEREQMQAAQEALQAEQDAKIAARQSALAKLAALGLTEDEIASL
jgi:DNA-binding NarL/FixJ family response regulator